QRMGQRQFSSQSQNKGERMVTDFLAAIIGHVRNDNSTSARGGEIDVVQPDAEPCDDAAALEAREGRRIEAGEIDYQAIGLCGHLLPTPLTGRCNRRKAVSGKGSLDHRGIAPNGIGDQDRSRSHRVASFPGGLCWNSAMFERSTLKSCV